jgi:hypothetical protein
VVSGMMTVIEEKRAPAKDDQWAERIAEQGRSGLSVKQFCEERGVWNTLSTLGANGCGTRNPCASVCFALVERGGHGRRLQRTQICWRAAAHRQRSEGGGVGPPCWKCASADDSPAGQRAGVPMPDSLRYAQVRRSFDRAACAGAGTPGVRCVRVGIFSCSASRRRDRIKILYRDRDGFGIGAKRLEGGQLPHSLRRARLASVRRSRSRNSEPC